MTARISAARRLATIALAIVTGLAAANAGAEARAQARLKVSGESVIDAAGRKVYIVQLNGPGAIIAAKGARAFAAKPDRRAAADSAVAAKALQFETEQARIVARIGPAAEQIYSYRYAFNGFAARMTPAEAQRLRREPGVVAIWEDSVRKVTTNASPEFLGLFDSDGGLTGDLGLRGENVVIGIVDSGIAPEHPSFADSRKPDPPRLCATSFGDTFLGAWLCRRFDVRPAELLFEPPLDWNGVCQGGDQFAETDCNNKLIGARFFAEGALANQQIDPNEFFSPRDADGHGTHIASTAAGNRVTAEINGANVAPIQGIAPRARIAAYKACWLKPGAIRASCTTSDLAQAIDTAVADGVDIISYSIGSDRQSLDEPDAIALLEAAKLGVFSAVAAGNDGPQLGTVGSPAGVPWVTTVAATSRTGSVFSEAIEILSPSDLAGKIASREANFTEPLEETGTIEQDLVLVDDGSVATDSGTQNGSLDDGCQAFSNAGEVAGKIAFVRRTGCEFRTKIDNAIAADAAAVVVFSNTGLPIVMTAVSSEVAAIPAVMIGQADGETIIDRLGEGETVRLRLANGLFLAETDPGNFVGSFSSRGPFTATPDILKPDVAAPGINILAATTPTQANGPKDVFYGYLTGTSMATPHVAGVAALLREANPDWSPAALRSALMTSAYIDGVFRDVDVPADAFDVGAGHIAPNRAVVPGLVYEASAIDYDAFGCGLDTPIPEPARCVEIQSVGVSTDPVQFNQASITIAKVTEPRIVERRVTNVGPAGTWQADVTAPPGFSVSVSPSVLTLGAGATASYQVAISQQAQQLDAWYFGRLVWRNGDAESAVPITLKAASVDAPAEIRDAGGSGNRSFDVKFGYTGLYDARVHGLVAPIERTAFVPNDPDRNFDAAGCEDSGVICFEHIVDPDALYLRIALFDEFTDGDDDLDLFVYYCPDGIGAFCPEIGVSGSQTSEEEFNLVAPPAGQYILLVHGFETDDVAGGPGANFTLFTWDLFGFDAAGNVVADDRGNLSIGAPNNVVTGSTETLTIDWSNLDPDFRYLGAISHGTPLGTSALTIVNIRN